jgi:hypothetical protein
MSTWCTLMDITVSLSLQRIGCGLVKICSLSIMGRPYLIYKLSWTGLNLVLDSNGSSATYIHTLQGYL